jgi:hypothetical protein
MTSIRSEPAKPSTIWGMSADTLESAARHLAAVGAAPSAEVPAGMVADKILCRWPSAD